MMALLDHHEVMGEHLAHGHEPMAWPQEVVPPAQVQASLGGTPVLGFALRPLLHGNSSFYVSEATGKVVERKSDTWRLWDFFWMLHNMDYAERKPASRMPVE